MIPSLEGWPTKTKEAPSPHEVKTDPAGHQARISKFRGSWGSSFQSILCDYRYLWNSRRFDSNTFSVLNIFYYIFLIPCYILLLIPKIFLQYYNISHQFFMSTSLSQMSFTLFFGRLSSESLSLALFRHFIRKRCPGGISCSAKKLLQSLSDASCKLFLTKALCSENGSAHLYLCAFEKLSINCNLCLGHKSTTSVKG